MIKDHWMAHASLRAILQGSTRRSNSSAEMSPSFSAASLSVSPVAGQLGDPRRPIVADDRDQGRHEHEGTIEVRPPICFSLGSIPSTRNSAKLAQASDMRLMDWMTLKAMSGL